MKIDEMFILHNFDLNVGDAIALLPKGEVYRICLSDYEGLVGASKVVIRPIMPKSEIESPDLNLLSVLSYQLIGVLNDDLTFSRYICPALAVMSGLCVNFNQPIVVNGSEYVFAKNTPSKFNKDIVGFYVVDKTNGTLEEAGLTWISRKEIEVK